MDLITVYMYNKNNNNNEFISDKGPYNVYKKYNSYTSGKC